jgi:hypothetical protein
VKHTVNIAIFVAAGQGPEALIPHDLADAPARSVPSHQDSHRWHALSAGREGVAILSA